MVFGKWVGLIAFIISLYILWKIQLILLLGFAALVFATVINRFVRFLQRGVKKRGMAVAISFFIFIALLGLFVWIVFPPFVGQTQELLQLGPQGLEQISNWLTWIERRLPEGMEEFVPNNDVLMERIQPFITQFVQNFFGFFADFLTVLGSALLVLVLTVMLMVNPDLYRRIFIQTFPAFYRRRAKEIMDLSEVALVSWAIGVFINTIFIGMVTAVGLWVLQVPLVLANSFIAGFMETIPNLGPTLSLIPPTLVVLSEGSFWKVLAVIGLYVGIQQFENYFLVPYVMKKTVLLPPVITLLSQIAFAIFFGVLALFLALPFIVIAQVWLQEVLVKDILNHWGEENTIDDIMDTPEIDEEMLAS